MRRLLEELMLELLRTYSPTGSEEAAVRRYISFVNGLHIVDAHTDHAGNAIIDHGNGGRWVLLAGHIDTVAGELPVDYEGGVFRGRGAVDAKGPLVAITVGALEALKHVDDRCRVTVVALVGEEGRSPGARALMSVLNSGRAKPTAVVVGEPSGCDGVVIGYRGTIKLKLKCLGSGGHSSNPSEGVSAIEELMRLWLDLKSLLGSIPNLSLSMNYIKGGMPFSVIPRECDALVDIRVPVGLGLDAVKGKLVELLSNGYERCVYSIDDETPPVKVSINAPIVRSLVRAIIRNNLKPTPVLKLGTSDMNLLAGLTSNIVSYGPGRSELSHTDREEISIEELELGARIYRDTITDYCSNP
ncbi:MAG: M20/M25/M40 family metallo-hydrolase [Zestosphaera sp.]